MTSTPHPRITSIKSITRSVQWASVTSFSRPRAKGHIQPEQHWPLLQQLLLARPLPAEVPLADLFIDTSAH